MPQPSTTAPAARSSRVSRARDGVVRFFSKRYVRVLAWVVPVCLLLAVAITQPGFPVQSHTLNDGAVWVTNENPTGAPGRTIAARFNKAIKELNGGIVTADGARTDVQQDAENVVVSDGQNIEKADPVLMRAGAPVGVPSQGSWSLGGSVVAVTDTSKGYVWARELGNLGDLRTGQDKPDLEAGVRALAVVSVNGTALVAGGQAKKAWSLQVAGKAVTATPLAGFGGKASGAPAQMTAVGDVPFCLTTDGWLLWPGHGVDLSSYGTGLVLQQPGPDSGRVLVEGSRVLLSVSKDGVVTRVVGTYGDGAVAQPVWLDGCGYAVWSAGTRNYVTVCGSGKPSIQTLESVTAESESNATSGGGQDLVFRVNRHLLVLNDVTDGRVWAPQQNLAPMKLNWNEVLPEAAQQQTSQAAQQQAREDVDCGSTSGQVQAKDDEYGVRAGQSAILNVLGNDSAPGCGVLAITGTSGLSVPSDGTMQLISDERQIEFTAASGAEGQTVTFQYTVADGQVQETGDAAAGASAVGGKTATVTVTIESADGDINAPKEATPGVISMEQQAQASYQVLRDFTDADGDPMTLVSARCTDDASLPLHYQSDGTLSITADGDPGIHQIEVKVSDGTKTTTGTETVQISPQGALAPKLVPTKADAYAQKTITVNAFQGLTTFPYQEPTLTSAVATPTGATVNTNADAGTFTFQAAVTGTYYVDITVSCGTLTATGKIRVDVTEPGTPPPPVAVVDTAYVAPGSPEAIDPLANDVAAPGEVMVLQKIDYPDEATGVQVKITDHDQLTISTSRQFTGVVDFAYTVSAGAVAAQTAVGHVRVMAVSGDAGQVPVVSRIPDQEVRTGGVVTIPVMNWASDPDGQQLTLVSDGTTSPLIVAGAESGGLLFASGDKLRYQAGPDSTDVDATFIVKDPDGNMATGRFHIRVRPSRGKDKEPPTPENLTARVFSGAKVTIPIPLTGIDVDGDGILLEGATSLPAHGTITDTGADWIEYTADSNFQGTDEFTYAVEDWVGIRATGTITVGVAADPDEASRVETTEDQVTVRPGVVVQARVLDNDADTGGGQLSLCGTPSTSTPGLAPKYDGVRVVLTAPATPGPYLVNYQACAGAVASAYGVLQVTVDPNAQILPPVVPDVVVPASDIVDLQGDWVTEDVTSTASNPSGPMSDLVAALPADITPGIARVVDSNHIAVKLDPTEPQMIPFVLKNTNPQAGGVKTRGYISVPAKGDFAPTLRPRALEDKPLSVRAGEQLTFSLGDYVYVREGRVPTIEGGCPADGHSSNVTGEAVKQGSINCVKNAPDQAVNGSMIAYTPDSTAAGAKDVSIDVTDQTSDQDSGAKIAVVTLPVQVIPGTAMAAQPRMQLVRKQLGLGDTTTVNLCAVTTVDGVANACPGLVFSLDAGTTVGFTPTLQASTLTVQVGSTVQPGTTGQVHVSARYKNSTMAHDTIELDVKDSIKPLARVVSIPEQTLNAGTSKTLDVFQGASNPYAPQPLYLDPSSVTVSPGDAVTVHAKANGQITITALSKPVHFLAKVQFDYNDYLKRPDRVQTGYFQAAVLERPAAPTAPDVGDPNEQGVVTVTWQAPANNGSPITAYQVKVSDGSTHDCGAVTQCQISGLTMGNQYSFQVRAQNQAGWSDWSGKSMTSRVDIAPGQIGGSGSSGSGGVSGLSVAEDDSKLDVSWSAPTNHGSAIKAYDLQVSSPDGGSVPSGGMITISDGSASKYTISGLDNGKSYNVRIRARNWKVGDWSDWVTGKVPSGAPQGLGGLKVIRQSSSELIVSWDPATANGDPKGTKYGLTYQSTAAPGEPNDSACDGTKVDVPAGQTSVPVSLTAPDNTVMVYMFCVEAHNNATDRSQNGEAVPKDTAYGAQYAAPTAPRVSQVSAECPYPVNHSYPYVYTFANPGNCNVGSNHGSVTITWVPTVHGDQVNHLYLDSTSDELDTNGQATVEADNVSATSHSAFAEACWNYADNSYFGHANPAPVGDGCSGQSPSMSAHVYTLPGKADVSANRPDPAKKEVDVSYTISDDGGADAAGLYYLAEAAPANSTTLANATWLRTESGSFTVQFTGHLYLYYKSCSFAGCQASSTSQYVEVAGATPSGPSTTGSGTTTASPSPAGTASSTPASTGEPEPGQ